MSKLETFLAEATQADRDAFTAETGVGFTNPEAIPVHGDYAAAVAEWNAMTQEERIDFLIDGGTPPAGFILH